MNPRGRCVTVPHAVPLGQLQSVTDVKHQIELIRHPRPAAKAEGRAAFENGQTRASNPYPVLSSEYASWDCGWSQANQEEG